MSVKPSEIERGQIKHAYARARAVAESLDIAQKTGRVNLIDKAQALALLLHEFNCHYDHTDGCSWLYEERERDPWLGDAHKKWLRLACKETGAQFPMYIERAEKAELRRMESMDCET